MPGPPLGDAFHLAVRKRVNQKAVATFQRDRLQPDESGDTDARASGDAAVEKLSALGYINPDVPANADIHNNRGQALLQRGRYREAIAEFQKAVELRPDFHAVYNNMAVCYGRLKMYPQAEESLLRAIAVKPDDFYAMNNLAVMYLELDRMDEARKMGERAVGVEPGYVNGHITLGAIYATEGEPEKAAQEFEAALALDPNNQSAKTNLERLEQSMSEER